MTIKQPGKTIIPYGSIIQPHELKTAVFLNKYGFDVEFLPLVFQKGVRTPDIKMNGRLWEIKSPKGDSRHTIERNLRIASKQSENIIFDLRRCKSPDIKSISQIKTYFQIIKKIHKILVITKSRTSPLEFKK